MMIVPHRNPVLAAKMLATLDMLSQGRIILGVGAGWMREEFEALGLPPFEERGDVTDEYIRVFKELWTSDDPSFDGKYCSFSNITFQPKPVQKPHIPIWVGGESPRALRRAAELGNGWSPIGSNPQFPLHRPEQLEAAIGRLAERCRRVGRDPWGGGDSLPDSPVPAWKTAPSPAATGCPSLEARSRWRGTCIATRRWG